MADNAQYWKGESLYGLKQFPEAILEFQKVVKNFPRSDKVPASVLKQGYCFFESKEYVDAKAFLQKVVSQYPSSEEASKAREKIQQIDELLAKSALPARTR
jgi:tol-pal system protein YbgF